MRVGMDVLRRDPAVLRGKRVGLLSHQAAVCADGASSAQALRETLGDRLVALFGPEHGFFGLAGPGEHTHSLQHPDWGIPVYSLYGELRKPSAEMLRGIDTLVFDLQDLGIRCYTYLGTLKLAMEACAECAVELVVADRPVPMPGLVDGPVAEPEYFSFVAPCALPMVYGMTPGETAQWLAERMDRPPRLTVVPLEGEDFSDWVRGSDWPEFIPPSPGIKSWEAARTYPATVFTEALTAVDCGRGTNMAFRVLGAPWLRAEEFCRRAVDRLGEFGLSAHPYRYTPESGQYAGQELDGIRLTIVDRRSYRPISASYVLMERLVAEYGKERVLSGWRPEWLNKLYGCDEAKRFEV